MSATTTLEPGMIDISGTSRPSLVKLIGVELRKMADTRAGIWLLIAIAAITLVVNTAFMIWGPSGDREFLVFLQLSGMPQGMLLPVLAILLVTQEWGQRTGLVTFSLVPQRGRTLLAKLVAAVILVVGAFLIALAIAALLTSIGGASDPWDGISGPYLGRVLLALLIGAVWGFGFGMALLNSAFAIVAYFAVPTVVSVVTAIWTSMQDKLLWFDLSTSSSMLFDPDGVDGKQWAQIATGALIWIVIPVVVGWIRINKAEIK